MGMGDIRYHGGGHDHKAEQKLRHKRRGDAG